MIDRTRLADIAVRESILIVLSVVGAILFINHQVLYFDGSPPSSVAWTAYAGSTLVIYAFGRAISVAAGMRTGFQSGDGSTCPECGAELRGETPRRVRSPPDHVHRVERAARPIPVTSQAESMLTVAPVNPPAPVLDDVVEALVLRLLALAETPQRSNFVNPPPSAIRPPPPDRIREAR